MRIELISIGDELLKGITLNSNAAFISAKLQEVGLDVAQQLTLPDNLAALKMGIDEALKRSDVVITTGGLGPTIDDKTREIAAEIFHSDFHFDQTVADDLIRRFGPHCASLNDQATIPSKAMPLLNPAGTAPGFIFHKDKKWLILLPGVPREMQPMFLTQALPHLLKVIPSQQKPKTERLYFCLIYESLLDPHLRELSKQFPNVEVGIYPSYGLVSVILRSMETESLRTFKEALISRFANYLYSTTSGAIEQAIQNWFIQQKKTLAFAESCTGGRMAAQITAIPGASEYFLGSLVTYSNELKINALGVDRKALKQHGAVSEEIVRQMCAGIFATTHADFAIAVSGIAGPTGGTSEKPIGTVWAAIGERGKPLDVGTFVAWGSTREMIIITATQRLLGALWRKTEKGIPAFPFILNH